MTGVSRAFAAGLIVATLIAGVLRFADLGRVPVSLYCDEAFHGYEAWSILETGRDSRGVRFPLFFDIFGKGWEEPLYVYLTVPAVALFGLTPLACRAAAALAGTLAVPLTGLMTAALLKRRPRLAMRAGVAAALVMAISPWSFHLSRVAFQASLLPPILAGAFWLAARALPRNEGAVGAIEGRSLFGAAVLLAVTLYTYTVARVEVPLIAGGFVWIHRREIVGWHRRAAVAAILLVLLALPIAGFSLTERGRQRFSDVSIFTSDESPAGPFATAARVAGNYLSYYSPRFLLTEGDSNLRHSIRGYGMLHPHGFFLLLVGAVAAAGGVAGRPGGWFLLWWLAVFPAAASLTIDPRHAVRAICGEPIVYALAGVGFAWLSEQAMEASRPRSRAGWIAAGVAAVVLSAFPTVSYFRDYFTAYPVYSGPWWQYGLRELYDYTESVSGDHDSIYITRNEDAPWIQLLFYHAIPPRDYQAHRLDGTKYLFDQEVFYKGTRIPNRANPIFVWKPWEVPGQGVEIRKVIPYPDGSEAFVVAW